MRLPTGAAVVVEHTHASYPVGHLSTMYWIGLQPGDVHMNISSSGWNRSPWSGFAAFHAGATVLVLRSPRVDARTLLRVLAVTTAANDAPTACRGRWRRRGP